MSEAEHLYRDIFENAVIGMFQTTLDGRYIAANSALARIYGYVSPDALRAALTDISRQLYVDPASRTEFVALMRKFGTLSGYESQIFRQDGSKIWISESCREVRSLNGDILYYEGSVEDITDRKLKEEHLAAAKSQAEAANEIKAAFLNNISHELRTPLNAIIGFSELIRDEVFGELGNLKYKEYIADIHKSGVHLLDMINDMLEFSRLGADRASLQDNIINLEDVVDSTLLTFSKQIERGGLIVRNEIGAMAPGLRADRRRIQQIIFNLISNAVVFTPPGGTITVSSAPGPQQELQLVVVDSGIGIAPDHQREILEPFTQVEDGLSRMHRGNGFGLPLAKRQAELHGGSLELSSELGIGTKVTVRFPKERLIQPTDRTATRR